MYIDVANLWCLPRHDDLDGQVPPRPIFAAAWAPRMCESDIDTLTPDENRCFERAWDTFRVEEKVVNRFMEENTPREFWHEVPFTDMIERNCTLQHFKKHT